MLDNQDFDYEINHGVWRGLIPWISGFNKRERGESGEREVVEPRATISKWITHLLADVQESA